MTPEILVADGLIWLGAKILFLLAFLIYMIFAGVVVRQVYLMTNTLQVGFEVPIRSLAWAHLFVAIGVFLLAFVTL